MPPSWSNLPVDPCWPPPPCKGIAVYKKSTLTKDLTYEGFICPKAPVTMPLSRLMASPERQMRLGKKFEILKDKIRAEEADAEAEAKARARHVPEDQKSGDNNCEASSKLGQSVKVELSATSEGEDTADESKQQIKEEATCTSGCESNGFHPLNFDVILNGQSLHPAHGGTEWTQQHHFDPWDFIGDTAFLKCEPVEEDPSFQWLEGGLSFSYGF